MVLEKILKKKTHWSIDRPFTLPTFHHSDHLDSNFSLTKTDLQQALIQANPNIFTPNLFWSLFYLVQDFLILTFLLYTREYWVFSGTYGLGYALWVLVTGFFMWALFVVGHDCGHGTFSRSSTLNFWLGHLCHAPLLVPYYGWKLSHYHHHIHHNDVDRDTVWYPIPESIHKRSPRHFQILRFSHILLFLYPIYLLDDGPMSSGNHYNPYSKLYTTPTDRLYGWISNICIVIFLIVYLYLDGILSFFIYYLPCYLVFIFWLDIVTFLHHTHPEGVYYRKPTWTFLKGGLTTIDRSYGWLIDFFHHSINLHVSHHLFFNKIPHYHLKEATQILKPLLGPYYRYDATNFFQAYLLAAKQCRYISNDGTRLKYQS